MRTNLCKRPWHWCSVSFAELQTIRQVLVWCRQEKVVLPALGNAQTTERIIWRLPVYSTVHHMLTNPVYAGAYAYGRRSARVDDRERTQAGGPQHATRLAPVGGFDPRPA